MELSELTFKVLDDPANEAHYCISWAEQLLESGCDNLCVAQLAICGLESAPDEQEVAYLFHHCIRELNLKLLDDWNEALIGYLASMCKNLLRGEMEPSILLGKILTLANDLDHPYILWPWINLAADIGFIGDSIIVCVEASDLNTSLDIKKPSECIFKMSAQFVSLSTIELPPSFPEVWWCESCGATSEHSEQIERATKDCHICHSAQAMKDMRYFLYREAFIKSAQSLNVHSIQQ